MLEPSSQSNLLTAVDYISQKLEKITASSVERAVTAVYSICDKKHTTEGGGGYDTNKRHSKKKMKTIQRSDVDRLLACCLEQTTTRAPLRKLRGHLSHVALLLLLLCMTRYSSVIIDSKYCSYEYITHACFYRFNL